VQAAVRISNGVAFKIIIIIIVNIIAKIVHKAQNKNTHNYKKNLMTYGTQTHCKIDNVTVQKAE